jgi:hypothetical protein
VEKERRAKEEKEETIQGEKGVNIYVKRRIGGIM